MVPLRKIFETLGVKIEWDQKTQTVMAIKGDTAIALKIGSKIAYKNNIPITLDAEPQIVNNRTVVPLRFIGESFGNEIIWDGIPKVVQIRK